MEIRRGTRKVFSKNSIPNRAQVSARKLAILLFAIALQSLLLVENSAARSSREVAEIPFKLYNDNLIVVKGGLGALAGVNLILDTGTTSTVISKSTADRLKLSGHAEVLQMLNGAVRTDSFTLSNIEIGTVSCKDFKVIVQDLGFLQQTIGISISGIVGLDVLSTQNLTIDYRARKISFGLISATRNKAQFATRVPLLTVETTIDGQAARLVLDSGTPVLMLFRNRLKRTGAMLASAPTNIVVTGAGRTQIQSYRVPVTLGEEGLGLRAIQIADADIEPDAGFDGLLGLTAMGFRKVSFDFDAGIFSWE